ncbi:hypothetical protein GCM10009665_54230 [Kitasatospora nipponensis]|uniref:Uncharacterized protein n=1 Tax=Kitasatospora nipponensis TaxID=258049 RepID=A0ABN1WN94_9ACTN
MAGERRPSGDRPPVAVRVARAGDGAVRVTAATGGAEAGGGAGAAFARLVLDVAGAVLRWPGGVRALADGAGSGLPSARIHDVSAAQEWLWALYGVPVAAAVQACALGEAGAAADLPAQPGPLTVAATRLAYGHWAARWWPASFPDRIPALAADLLGLERAASTYRCQQLFDGSGEQFDDCAAELIEEHEAGLDPLIAWWHGGVRDTASAGRVERILRLVDAAADGAGLDGPALRGLRTALDRRPPGTEAGPPRPSPDLGALFARQRDYALAAGDPSAAGGRVIARGTGLNDWRRYPPGALDACEDALTWTVRALGARRRIEVEALAGVAGPWGGPPLVAEITVDGGPAGRIPLTARGDALVGQAEVALPAAGPGRIEVGVLLPGFDPGPEPASGAVSGVALAADPSADRAADRAEREAVRGSARRRLARETPGAAPAPLLAEAAAAAVAATDTEDY